jgi:hypothetical protein
MARPRLRRSPLLVHSAAHTPRDSASGAFASLAWIGSDAASCKAARQRAVGCSMRVRSGIVHRWHSVATQCMWLQHIALRHTCVAAQRQMSRRAAVVAQMSARDGLGCMADVGDEHNPKRRCGRIGVSRTKLPCAAHKRHVHETCPPSGRKPNSAPRDYSAAGVSTQQTRHSVRRRSARKDSTADCGLPQPSVAPRRQPQRIVWASSRQLRPKRECSGVGNGLSGNAPE